ncbi:hypothetical protein FAM18172_02092 [Lacticaseibacillus paracasei]|uniref:Uncharacterized protein n=1 Tax=Lacticaseibacillus paracasei TaxID=1597 RepID=A0A422M8Z2_LACPA|nr:hypothetical protein FAM18172_02092 [Lacticaseibacillus paracasei]
MSTSETRARSFSGKWVKYFTTANVLISLISGAMKKSPTCIFKARAMSVIFDADIVDVSTLHSRNQTDRDAGSLRQLLNRQVQTAALLVHQFPDIV